LTGHDALAKAEADEIVDAMSDLATMVYPTYKVGLLLSVFWQLFYPTFKVGFMLSVIW
jgi:hypothetical protein